MKKIIFIFLILFIILFIYLFTKDNKIYYLSLGDELKIQSNNENKYSYTKYISDYLENSNKLEKTINNYYKDNMRTIDLIEMINNNEKSNINNKNVTIQNSLIKADLVTLSIGNNDLISKFSLYELYDDSEMYNYIDDYLVDLEKLFKLVRKYCKEKIIFIGYYNIFNNNELDKYYKYLIDRVKKLTKIYDIDNLDMYEEFNNLKYRSKYLYPSEEGYKYIGQEIIKIINK